MKTCKTCRWLDVPPGEQRRAYRMFPCRFPLPTLPALPESARINNTRPPFRLEPDYMCPSYGAGCQTWERIEPQSKKARKAPLTADTEMKGD
jgi:hypothetical protein